LTDLIEIDVLLLGAGGGILLPRSFSPAPGFASSLVDPIANLGGNCPTEGCVPSKAGCQYPLAIAMSQKTIPPRDRRYRWSISPIMPSHQMGIMFSAP
jgi:pyruvate/2-oxoglutarate dehydrogenase complex dihydrolipoamide dehydrogenase (E3) component